VQVKLGSVLPLEVSMFVPVWLLNTSPYPVGFFHKPNKSFEEETQVGDESSVRC
jgi:hypothetical protein